MKTGILTVLIVGLISTIECDLIKDTAEIGVSIIRRVLADEREFGFNFTVSVNAEAYQELIKFNASVTKKSIPFLQSHQVENLQSFIDSFNKSMTSTIMLLNSKYSPSSFHAGIEYVREKYGNLLLKDLNNRTEEFESFLNHSLNLNNCTIFKFLHTITNTITVLSETIPSVVKEEAENYSGGLRKFKSILVNRGIDFENALTNCSNIKTTSVECCIDIYWSKECNVIQNTVTVGERIIDKVIQNKTVTAKKITNTANIISLWKLRKVIPIINEKVEKALKKHNVTNLRDFVNLLNSTINKNIDEVLLDYSTVEFSLIVEDTHNDYQKEILDGINNKSAEFQDFLNNHTEISDCATFKFQYLLTTVITNLENDIPVFISLMEVYYNKSLTLWRNKISTRKMEFIKSLDDCEKHDDFKCCMDDYIAGKGLTMFKDISLDELIKNTVSQIVGKFKDQIAKALLIVEKSFSELYLEISLKC
ncbi:unnamed protein product [Diamesa serratosioi]